MSRPIVWLIIAQWFPAVHLDGTRLKAPQSEIKNARKLVKPLVLELLKSIKLLIVVSFQK